MIILNSPTGTPTGRQMLGRLIRGARVMRGWSLAELRSQIAQNVSYWTDEGVKPYIVSESLLSMLERGKPVRDSLLFESIAVLHLLEHPAEHRPLTLEEIKSINCGLFNLKTGQWVAMTAQASISENSFSVIDSALAS
ncbi:hypothetical protein ACQ4M3_37955 [Leptolyngbya sp. AN03gr2]|uniref:hypothetical protein n=1 Tax=unclassified Leptolyngbya TaxID=2650499 RepID=UPI003D32020D